MLYFCVVFLCCMKLSLLVLCLCCMRVVKKNRKTKMMCCIFPRVEFALVLYVIYFPRVELALVFCVIYFRVWNAIWYFVLYFSTCRTRYVILCCIFMRVERALIVCVIFFCVQNVLWYFVLYILLLFSSFSVVLYLTFFPLFFSFVIVWNYPWFIQIVWFAGTITTGCRR